MKWFKLSLLLLLSIPLQAQTLTSTLLPILIINTHGLTIPDEPKINVSMTLIDNGPGIPNHPSDQPNAYNGTIGIELRGSTSQFYDKKAYAIELRYADGSDRNASLLGMPEESDWALIAPLNDKTLMRDVLAYHYAAQAMDWAPRTRYCEVLLNGQYEGVYILIETIKRDKNRVNVKKLEAADIADTSLTGGYILRMDKYGPSPGAVGGNWVSNYPPKPGGWQQTWFQYSYPKEENIQSQQEIYIQQYIRNFEIMLAGPNAETEYTKWIDVDSWVDYLLVNELCKNTDGYRLSAYFYKDRNDVSPLIHMGPVWDFNIAFGIGDYCEGPLWTGWAKDFNSVCPDDAWVIHFWWERLWQMPSFRKRITERWTELRAGAWSDIALFGTIDSLHAVLNQAQVRNFQRWPVLGTYVWPNSFVGASYPEEVDFLENWLRLRLGWLDEQIPTLYTKMPEDPNVVLFPNPAHSDVYLTVGKNTESSHSYSVSIFSMDGRVLYREAQSAHFGVMHLELPEGLPPGVYLIRLMTLSGQVYLEKLVVG